MKKDIKQKFVAIARDIVRKPDIEENKLLDLLFLDGGYIDSFQLVEMITALEHEFGVRFAAEDLTSKRFRTFKGVLEIIEENRGKKKK